MHRQDKIETADETQGAGGQCCHDEAGCEAGLRNNYYQGKLLTPDTFRVEQRYLVERRRLINRAIHGWGVVYGYAIDIAPRRLCVKPGLALDQCGRELVQVGTRRLALDQLIIIDDKCEPILDDKRNPLGYRTAFAANQHACWLLQAHYAEQSLDGVRVVDGCRCEHEEWDHTCETVRYSLTRVSCDDGCCADQACELECTCGSGRCCEPAPGKAQPAAQPQPAKPQSQLQARAQVLAPAQAQAPAQPQPQAQPQQQPPEKPPTTPPPEKPPTTPPPEKPPAKQKPLNRGGCGCLCGHLTDLALGAGCDCALSPVVEPCGHGQVKVDLGHGIPLACLEVEWDDECGDWKITSIDACGPRRLVKRNDLLFDLIRGCDLTRIASYSWSRWHRQEEPVVPYADFSRAFGPDSHNELTYVTALAVRFSRPVRKNTLLPDCFAITVLTSDRRDDAWWQGLRVPIVAVQTEEPVGNGDLVQFARLIVDGPWVEDGLRGASNLFQGQVTRVEIEVRGDLIVDCNGQTVDANTVGLARDRTGNGTPGGSFLSTFRVGPAPAKTGRPRPIGTIEGAQS